jgi:hypothetical protein
MNRSSIAFATALAVLGGTAMMIAQGQSNEPHGNPNGAPPNAVVHWARGEAPAARPRQSPNLTYHGGAVAHGTTVQPIFWGTSWNNNPQFVADKVSGLQSFYSGVGNSTYAQTNGEYTDSTGAVGVGVTLGNTVFDFSAESANGQNTSPILAEVCAQIPNPVANGYYPVYTDRARGSARFCAWHSAGTCGNTTVQFAFFFKLDGDAGCDPQDTSGLHSQGLAALANVSGHELSEMMTDRHLDAWFDSAGSENSDKCAWTFGTPLLSFGGSQWKVQGNWSNSAFNASRGYPNSSGQRGCLDGGNFR